MKKIFLAVAIIVIAFAQTSFAQLVPSQREDSVRTRPSSLLTFYYNIKDALVNSNSTTTASSAESFVKALNDFDKETIKDESRAALLNDAEAISQTKDLKVQREKFATLSTNMFALAKTAKLSAQPVYQQYCLMKKASWLSDSKTVKNPYYGSAMLTCGSVRETIQ